MIDSRWLFEEKLDATMKLPMGLRHLYRAILSLLIINNYKMISVYTGKHGTARARRSLDEIGMELGLFTTVGVIHQEMLCLKSASVL
jgi:hypothetical protein